MTNRNTLIFSLLIATLFSDSCVSSDKLHVDNRIESSGTQNQLQVFAAAVNPNSIKGISLSRAQFIGLINFSKLVPVQLNTDTFNTIMCDMTDAQVVDYDTQSLVLEWKSINDSTVYLQYVGEPVQGLIYTFNDTIQKTKWVFTPQELIWIGSKYVYRDTVRWPITPKIKNLLNNIAVDIDIPDMFFDNNILKPIEN